MKLLLEGFVLTLAVALWVGGLEALGAYIYACGASERVEAEGTAPGMGTKGAAAGCRPYLRPHIATSRKPGVAPSELVPRGENSQQEAWQPRTS